MTGINDYSDRPLSRPVGRPRLTRQPEIGFEFPKASSNGTGAPPPGSTAVAAATPPLPPRLPPPDKKPLATKLIGGLAIVGGAMLTGGMMSLMPGDGLLALGKACLVGVAATGVAYGVNRLAATQGAPLAVVGYRSALFASVSGIALVGATIASMTYAGLAIDPASKRELEAHGVNLVAFAGNREQATQQAARIIPAIASIASNMATRADCAARPSCYPASRNERIAAVRASTEKATRAQSISASVEAGRARLQGLSRASAELLAQYQATARATDLPIAEAWLKAQQISARIVQTAAGYSDAVPVTLAAAYAAELSGDANESVRAQGANLKAVVDSIERGAITPPAFPEPVGVAGAFRHAAALWPIASLAGIIDLVVPLLVWLYLYLSLAWAYRQASPPPPRDPDDHDDALGHVMAGRDPITRAPLNPPTAPQPAPGAGSGGAA